MGGTDKTSWLEGMEHDDDAALTGGPADGGYTETLGEGWSGNTVGGPSDVKTVLSEAAQDDGRTRIAIGRTLDDEAAAMDDPVTGWLVVIEGPGLGRAVPLGAGLNMIGRAEEERVALPFGDRLLSARDHLRIIYDDETRSFLVVPGSGRNISRMNGQIIAMPMPLANYATIQLTKATRLRFAAFCSDSFDWSEVADDQDNKKA